MDAGELNVLGILQEQHGDRARLFHQWQGLNFPLLVDSFNELGVKVVPIHLLLDRAGRIALVNPRPEAVRAWLQAHPTGKGAAEGSRSAATEPLSEAEQHLAAGSAVGLKSHRLDVIVARLRKATQDEASAARAWFRLGVALRMRFESGGAPADFAASVDSWHRALALDPNQYIWRRRIQQYGPRLDKPYPFYDWVETARAELRARKEQPIPLAVEPRGAELAQPLRDPAEASPAPTALPEGWQKVIQDDGLLLAHATVVRDTQGRRAARVHLELRPNPARAAHWNNEVEPARLWLRPADGWQTSATHFELPGPASAVSEELRRVEFELSWPEDVAPNTALEAVLLAHVCENEDGLCVYRRLPIRIQLPNSVPR